MKKLIASAFCFALAAGVLTGCGGSKTIDTTKAPVTITTTEAPTTTASNTLPTSEATLPTTMPHSSTMPDHGENGGAGNANGSDGTNGSIDNPSGRSRIHAPSIVGKKR